MKNIRIKSVLCAALATSSLYVGAQNLPSELLDASSDSLSVAEEELVQVAYRKVNKKDLLGGVSSVNVEELMKKDYFTYSLDGMENIRFCQVILVLAYVFEARRSTIVSVGDNHFVFDDQRSYLTALAIRVFRPDACHTYVTFVQFQLFLFRVHESVFYFTT